MPISSISSTALSTTKLMSQLRRSFSDAFLETYLEKAGDILTKSVGAYAFEGLGAQLFEKVDGDFYAILGLDLIPLLGFLRREGLIAE